MKKLLHTIKSKQYRRRGLACAILLALLGFMILPASAQINAQKKYIFLSGQLTNTTTGAPIPDHQIYISSDSLLNNGFGYYATAKTDVNGFYRDTIVTTSPDGIIKIYLYDFDNIMIQLDRYYRFIWENEYLMFADFAIFNPDANEELQANFTPQEDPGENPLKIIFKDQSFGVSIKAWLWDFGDGVTSTVQDPEHVYDQAGVYLVTLTIAALPECQNCLTSTITKQVQVGLTEYYHIGGHVFAQYFPIDLGLAYLYTYDSENHLVPVDTAQIDTLGFYYFYELDAGKKYLTKARLAAGSVMYGQFMPTYLGNVFDWNYAQEIVLTDENNFECDIHLLPSYGINAGAGQIVGQIIYDTSLVERSPIPAGDIEILLLDGQGNSLTCGLSDVDGNFSFSDIDNGTYQLFPDVAGISTTPMYVTISEGEPLAGDVTLVIYPQQITFSVPEHISTFINQAFIVYPNPVSDQARISIKVLKASNITVMVTDLLGRVISKQDRLLPEGSQEIILPVRELPAGLYEVVLIPEDKVMISGKFLKSN